MIRVVLAIRGVDGIDYCAKPFRNKVGLWVVFLFHDSSGGRNKKPFFIQQLVKQNSEIKSKLGYERNCIHGWFG